MEIPVPEEVWAQIKEALYANRKIEAIKLYRDATKLGLKESKDAIDALDAELRKATPERFAANSSGAGCFTRAALFILTVASVFMLR